ncbi:MAG: hypothetical protein IJG35_07440, partial [Bacteroidales bacterium]|nr:hypothetical protein [Bacteroidales bacterium]
TKTGRDVFDGMTRLKQLHILKAIFKSVLFAHNKTPKVFCLTFGVHVSRDGSFILTLEDFSQQARSA